MSSSSTCPSDLIFTVLGGQRHGKQLPVRATKCVLAFDGQNRQNGQSSQPLRCAILRRQSGVVIRTLDPDIQINNEQKEVHWLQTGDVIRFPNAMTLQVTQLGSIELEADAEPSFPSSLEQQSTEKFDEGDVDDRLGIIEKRLDQLSEQIESLVSLASSGTLETNPSNEPTWPSCLDPDSQEPAPDTESTTESPQTDVDSEVEIDEPVADDDQTPTPLPSWSTEYETDSSPGLTAEQPFQPGDPPQLPQSWVSPTTTEEPWLTPVRRSLEENSTSPSLASPTVDSPPSAPIASTEPAPALRQSLASRFSTMGDVAEVPPEASNTFETSVHSLQTTHSPQTQASEASEPPLAEPTSSIDESLDALLKRLYAEASTETASATLAPPSTIASPDGSDPAWSSGTIHEPSESSVLNAFNETSLESSEPSPYADMQFGYQLNSPSQLDEVRSEVGDESMANPLLAQILKSSSQVSQHVGLIEETQIVPSTDNQPPSASDSVSDLLARLKMEGGWDSSEDTAPGTTVEPHSGSFSIAEASNEPTLSYNDSSLFVESSPAQDSEGASSDVDQNDDDNHDPENDSVEDYMSQLLARMQKSASPTPSGTKSKSSATPNTNATTSTPAPITHDVDQSVDLMTPEEYQPKQRAQKLDSFDSMREIANSTARNAVAASDLNRRHTQVLMQFLIGGGAIVMALYYLLSGNASSSGTAQFLTYACLIFGVGAIIYAFRSFQQVKKLELEKPQSDEEPQGLHSN